MFWEPKLALIAAGMLSLAACSAAPIETAAPAPAESAVVTMGMTSFNPATITIARGQKVEWRNTSPIAHTVTADKSRAANPENVQLPQGAESFHSGAIAAGASWSYTFTVPGTYQYLCLPHERAGMIGTVIVR